MLYADVDYIRIPYVVHEAYLENYGPLLKEFDLDQTGTDLRFADGMFFSVICAEEIGVPADIPDPFKDSFLSDFTYKNRLNACRYWPVADVSHEFSTPISSEVPTLGISGGLDPAISSKAVELLSKHLSEFSHVEIPYMGHMFVELSNPECYDSYVLAFFEAREQFEDKGCFSAMKPKPFKLPTSSSVIQ
jgi:pimeloyl-ACP methyl ester carboxylesterase